MLRDEREEGEEGEEGEESMPRTVSAILNTALALSTALGCTLYDLT